MCAMRHAAESAFHAPFVGRISHVIEPSSDREVGVIHTPSVIATVHHMQTRRDRSFCEFIGNTVGINLLPAEGAFHDSVASCIDSPNPSDASIVLWRSEFFEEPFCDGSDGWHNYEVYMRFAYGRR